MTVAPRLIQDLSTPHAPKAPHRTTPLYREIHDWQDHALDGVGTHSSAVLPFRNAKIADRNHDKYADMIEARARAQGDEIMLSYVRGLKHWDAVEDTLIDRVWSLFSGAADSCRKIVRAVECLFGRTGK